MDISNVIANIGKWTENYTPTKLFSKIGSTAKAAGKKAVYAALLLYYALTADEVPLKDKLIVIGALGYFICPADLIPDFVVGLGYTDDVGVLVWATKTIWNNITPATHQKARERLSSWFGEVSDSEIKIN